MRQSTESHALIQSASLVSSLGDVGDLVVASNGSFCHQVHEGRESKFVVVVVVIVVIVVVVFVVVVVVVVVLVAVVAYSEN